MNRVNFLPQGYLEKKSRRRTGVVFATVLGVVIGGVAVMALALRISNKQLQNQHEAVEWKCIQAYRTIQEIKDMRAQQLAIAKQAEMTASLIEKVPRSDILAEIGKALPPGVSLLDLALKSAEDNTSSDAKLTLSGVAGTDAQVEELIAQLKRSKLFSSVMRTAEPEKSIDGKSQRFNLEISLNSDASASAELPLAQSQTVFLNP